MDYGKDFLTSHLLQASKALWISPVNVHLPDDPARLFERLGEEAPGELRSVWSIAGKEDRGIAPGPGDHGANDRLGTQSATHADERRKIAFHDDDERVEVSGAPQFAVEPFAVLPDAREEIEPGFPLDGERRVMGEAEVAGVEGAAFDNPPVGNPLLPWMWPWLAAVDQDVDRRIQSAMDYSAFVRRTSTPGTQSVPPGANQPGMGSLAPFRPALRSGSFHGLSHPAKERLKTYLVISPRH
jgi:hypothetical protein